jgi:thiol:disulfide interchange protein DsbD
MKAMALARLSGEGRRSVRPAMPQLHGGVLVSFAAIGGALVALRAAGSSVGWGFQFTEPAFVAGMAWLMLAVGLNLSGVFAMGGTVGRAGGRLGAAGISALRDGRAGGGAGHALHGALHGGGARARAAMPPAQTMAVFLALGLGLALPYALLGVFRASPAHCRGRGPGWSGCARRSPSRCSPPRPGWSGCWRSRRGRMGCSG